MKKSITNVLVKSLKPQEKPFEIRDTTFGGLLIRVQPTGSMTYYYEYERGKRIKIGKHPNITPDLARKKAKEHSLRIFDGEDPVVAKKKANANTLEEFITNEYKPWASTHIKTGDATVKRILKQFEDFGNKRLTEITFWNIEKWKTKQLKAGKKPSTVNRCMDDLKSSLNKAVEWGIIKENPVKGVKKCKVDKTGTIRYLSKAEEKSLRKALKRREEEHFDKRDSYNQWREERGTKPLQSLRSLSYVDHLEPMVLLSLNTGLRRGELFNLEWPDIDFAKKILTVNGEGAKSGQTRYIPLNKEALETLQKWQKQTKQTSGLIFQSKGGKRFDNVNKAWKGLLERAEITGFRWHDLRHTFASNLVMAGVDLNTVRELLGHADYEMTLRYAHLAPEHKAEAVERLMKGK